MRPLPYRPAPAVVPGRVLPTTRVRRRRRRIAVAAALLAASTAATAGPPSTAAPVAPAAGPAATSAAAGSGGAPRVRPAIAGETTRITGRLPGVRSGRDLVVQRLDGARWRPLVRGTARGGGRYAVELSQPERRVSLRVSAPKRRGARAVRSRPVTSTPLAQSAALDLAVGVRPGEPITTRARFSPARPGRAFTVDHFVAPDWVTVAEGVQDADGVIDLTLPAPSRGQQAYRVTAAEHRGAVAVSGTAATRAEAPRVLTRGADGTPLADLGHEVAVDGTGRYVAFTSRSGQLGVPNPDRVQAVWLADTEAGTTRLVSRTYTRQVIPDADSRHPAITADGSRVLYETDASDVFHEPIGHTVVVDHTPATGRTSYQAPRSGHDGDAVDPSVSPDGSHTVFVSSSSGYSADPMRKGRLVRYGPQGTEVLDVGHEGAYPDGGVVDPTVADDGTTVFVSAATNLVGEDTNERSDVFVWGRRYAVRGLTTTSSSGADVATISGNGDTVVLSSAERPRPDAPGDGGLYAYAVLADRWVLLDDAEAVEVSVSRDGRTVVCTCLTGPGGSPQVRVIDLATGAGRLVPHAWPGRSSAEPSTGGLVSGDGRTALYASRDPLLTGSGVGAAYPQVLAHDLSW